MSIPGANRGFPFWPGSYPETAGPQGPAGPTGPTGPAGDGVTGSIVMYGNVTAPGGWLLCDGSHYLQSAYAPLYAIIGNTFSAGATNGPTFLNTYNIASNVITFQPLSGNDNVSVNVGCKVTAGSFNSSSGATINGLVITITSAPALGTEGVIIGTFDIPQGDGAGVGNSGFVSRITFQTPDAVGITVRGSNNVSGPNLGVRSGADSVVLTPANLPSHGHNTPGNAQQGIIGYNNGALGYGGNGNLEDHVAVLTTGVEVLDSELNVVTATSASGTAVATLNSYIALVFIIKT